MARKINYDNWSREELEKELRRIKETKYGLVWHRDLPEEKIDVLINPDARTPSEMFPNEMAGKPFPVLKEVGGKEIETDKLKPVNLLIQGDNYHSLAVLNFTHEEAVDLIYIDPPYNTGNDDFIYTDKFTSGYVKRDDPFRHSKWLSFMEKRLKLAKNLLKKSGVIFVSIDDNEFAQLKLMMDEPDLFGERNLIGVFSWVRKRKPSHLDAHVRKNTEFVICYAKDISKVKALKSSSAEDNKPYPFYNSGNSRGMLAFPGFYVKTESLPDGTYKAGKYPDKKTVVELLNDITVKGGVITTPFKLVGEWRYSQQTLDGLLAQKERIVIKGKKFKPYYIRKLTGSIEELKNAMTILGSTGKLRRNLEEIEPELLVGTNEDAEEELNQFGLKIKFNNPKPVSLIRFLTRIATAYNKSAIVLDFMAGSGTTGQAVLELNKEDSGQRRFILCTNNENDICTEVCYPRLKRVIEGYKNLKSEKVEGLGGNLKYYVCDFVEAKPTDLCKRKLVNKCTEMLCIHENTFEPVQDGNEFKIFRNADQYLGIVFYEDAINDFKKAIAKIKGHCNAYVFSMTDDPHKSQFADVAGKVTLCAIPEVILKVYREIFKEQ